MTDPKPLNAEEEADLRAAANDLSRFATHASWARTVQRLLATLDAARASRPEPEYEFAAIPNGDHWVIWHIPSGNHIDDVLCPEPGAPYGTCPTCGAAIDIDGMCRCDPASRPEPGADLAGLTTELHAYFSEPQRGGVCEGTHSLGYGECQELTRRLAARGVTVPKDQADVYRREKNP